MLRVLPSSCATNFCVNCVAKSRRRFYFLQHENLLRKKVVISATNHLNLQRNIVARQVARKMLPVLLGLKDNKIKVYIMLKKGWKNRIKTQIDDCKKTVIALSENRSFKQPLAGETYSKSNHDLHLNQSVPEV